MYSSAPLLARPAVSALAFRFPRASKQGHTVFLCLPSRSCRIQGAFVRRTDWQSVRGGRTDWQSTPLTEFLQKKHSNSSRMAFRASVSLRKRGAFRGLCGTPPTPERPSGCSSASSIRNRGSLRRPPTTFGWAATAPAAAHASVRGRSLGPTANTTVRRNAEAPRTSAPSSAPHAWGSLGSRTLRRAYSVDIPDAYRPNPKE